jgi:hypothetical protein
MSEPEARVFLFLRGLGVPFSWRQFDGQSQAPTFMSVMQSQNFVPEFTLTEYKIIILVIGDYYGSIPGILNTAGLAQACFENDGWKVAALWQTEIINDVGKAIFSKLPILATPSIKGGPKNFAESYDKKYLERVRQFARGNAFKRRKYFTKDKIWVDRTSIRKPKRGDRRRSAKIVLETKPQEDYLVGGSRLSGAFNTSAFKKTKYRTARTTRYALPLYRKQPEKGQQ